MSTFFHKARWYQNSARPQKPTTGSRRRIATRIFHSVLPLVAVVQPFPRKALHAGTVPGGQKREVLGGAYMGA
eukprot:scaffold63256_cov73-Phaeocystis_antarctica.AAC.2